MLQKSLKMASLFYWRARYSSLSDLRFPELELFVSAVAVVRLVEILPAASRGPGTLRRAAIFARHVRTC
ncbi:BQ5605_C002g01271 [Microbotryum silenes-dioicae]|uniref:BQ5605_C002g01271 protein n=1 Tax=Microbotryum silenes-dioicae TaxID=796604 RepID=A0A2X0M268_9BASI|nr:BQ5605_C002g01271 [Microbotryum silenes-dioicae]